MENKALVKADPAQLDQMHGIVDNLFQSWLYRGKKKSKETIKVYLYAWNDFQKFTQAKDRDAAAVRLFSGGVGEANDIVEKYMEDVKERRKLSVKTANLYLSALNSLVKKAKKIGYVNWTLGVDGEPAEKIKDTKGPGMEVITRILSLLRDRQDPKSVRDYAMILFMKENLFRRESVLSLDIQDIDFDQMRVLVKFKGSTKKDFAPISESMAEALRKWLKIRNEKRGPVFVKIGGLNRPDRERLTGLSLWRIVQEHGKEIGLKRNIWPHSFRHSGISYLAEKGYSIPEIMSITRHKDPKTVALYFDDQAKTERKMNEVLSAA